MNTKIDLKNLSLEEMSHISGGNIALAISILGACIYIYNNSGDFAAGYRAARN
ncbi:MAG: hypothetical protein IPM71_15635 [Bacteroidota bacterium]|nr:MAG: hypothetical protein IPM71_15635 [Bacteroidota bacterium]